MEVATNALRQGREECEVEHEFELLKRRAERADLSVWSVHLPFSRTMEVCAVDKAARRRCVDYIRRYIDLSARFGAQRLVLHPSTEPIETCERERKIELARRSIEELTESAEAIGAMLSVENLPRTCLGNTVAEMEQLTDNLEHTGICFDTNHLLTERTELLIERVGSRIATIHCSDFDGHNECHWVPGQGVTDWGATLGLLTAKGYRGPFVFEVFRNSDATKPTIEELWSAYHTIVAPLCR